MKNKIKHLQQLIEFIELTTEEDDPERIAVMKLIERDISGLNLHVETWIRRMEELKDGK